MRVNTGSGSVGSTRFQPVYLISDQWLPFVAPALKKIQASADALSFDVKPTLDRRNQLQALLLNGNPFVAVAAAHTLEQAHLLDAEFVRGPLAKAKGIEQSVFVYLALEQLPTSK